MLDKTDKKIIRIMDANSRAHNTAIAKKAGISKQLLKYRLDNLVKNGVIDKFYTVINGVKLGMMYFRVYLRFQGIDSKDESELIDRFASNQYVTWVIRCRGQWDMIVSSYAEDTEHFSSNFWTILGSFQKNILTKKIVLIQNVIFSTRDYISSSDRSSDSVYGGITEHTPIDDTEHKILVQLSRNSRISVVALAKKVRATPDAVRSRIKRLEKVGIIRGHKLALNFSKTGVLFFLVSMTFSNASEASRKKLERYCKAHPNVVYYVNLLGDHDADLEAEVESQDDMDGLIRDLRNKFPDIIRDIETTQVTRQDKIDYYPFKSKPV